jgi:Flp pilus assembly protein TadD
VKLEELGQAIEVLRHAHELNPQDTSTADLLYSTALNLAEENQKGGKHSDALRYFEEAATLHPQNPEPHRGMAESYAQSGKSAQAETERQEADRLSKQ